MDDRIERDKGRFSLRLPPDVAAEVRAFAKGNGTRPPAGINETILFLIQEGLKAVKKEKAPGPWSPALRRAA
jgi:hypothetical protein